MKELSWHPMPNSSEHYYFQQIQAFLSQTNIEKTTFSEMIVKVVNHFNETQIYAEYPWKKQHELLKTFTPITGAPTIYKASIEDENTHEFVCKCISSFRIALGVQRVNLGLVLRIMAWQFYTDIVEPATKNPATPTDSEILNLTATINTLLAKAITKKDKNALQSVVNVLTEERNTDENA